MTDPQRTLSSDEVTQAVSGAGSDAGLTDWRLVLGRLTARFRTGDFATGLALVDRIGAAAEEANHHPDLSLTYPEVIVTLSSHDVGGITSRDLDLARQISTYAAALGATAHTAGLTRIELGLDTADGSRLAPFYAALLGQELSDGELQDPSGQVPVVWWQEPDDEARPESALPAQEFDQRWHLDVRVPVDEGPRRVQAAMDAGGRLVSDAGAPSFWVLEDADGNRSCICTSGDRP